MNNKLLFIANWKSNKNTAETLLWFEEFEKLRSKVNLDNKEIIIAPSYLSIPASYTYIQEHKLPINLAVQDISMFDTGAYTGEVAASQALEYAKFAIIGHSERRKNQHESDDDIALKTAMAKDKGLKTIVCVQNEETPIPQEGTDIVAYEPVFAIGTGNPDTPENITSVFTYIHEKNPDLTLLYGGSVAPDTITNFKNIPLLSGFLIGSASLEAESFIQLLLQC